MLPKISVILPIFNGEKFIAQCLENLLSQTLREIEIIVINDGSTDNTGKVLQEFTTQDSRIVIVEQENQGAGMARNAGLKIAKGEFIAFMDSDDRFYAPNTLEILYTYAKAHNAKICGGAMEFAFDFGAREREKEFGGFYFDKNGFVAYKDYQFDFGFTRFIYAQDLFEGGGGNLLSVIYSF